MNLRGRALWIGLAICAVDAHSARAQVVRGVVVEEGTERRIVGVEVAAVDSVGEVRGRTLSDSAGRFWLGLERGGVYHLRAQHLGYANTMVEDVEIADREEMEIVLRLGIAAIPIEPLVVVARRPERLGRLAEYYDRADWIGKTGIGRFISRSDIEARPASETSDLLRMIPGVRVVAQSRSVVMTRQGGGCAPAVYVDGMLMNREGRAAVNDYVTPEMIEGIEIYRGSAESPARYQDRSGCGSILIWTREGDRSGRPLSWWRMLVGGTLLLGIILLGR